MRYFFNNGAHKTSHGHELGTLSVHSLQKILAGAVNVGDASQIEEKLATAGRGGQISEQLLSSSTQRPASWPSS